VQFKDIIGQDVIKTKLLDMYSQQRLSHAMLFLGREGSGALSLARAFVQYIVCDKHRPQPPSTASLFGEPEQEDSDTVLTDSCGQCPSCKKAAAMAHPDIHFSYPTISIKKDRPTLSTDMIVEWRKFMDEQPYGNAYDWLQHIDAENKQGNISSAECLDIIRKLSLKSFESEYKFLIMWMPEMLGKEGNKLLKLIEEPPAKTIFILVAENEQLVLPTILSRTQLVKIPSLSNHEIENGLISRYQVESSRAKQIALMCQGNFNEALHQQLHLEDNWETTLRDWMNTILKTGPAAQVKWVEEVAKIGREKQKQFLLYFNHTLQHAVKISVMAENITDFDGVDDKQQGMLDFAARMGRLCNLAQLEAIITEIDRAAYQIERNANAKMLFHALTIRLYHIISNKSLILMP
jgi:DNA polymerase-3 subunit delta'